jgi:hypothetical protein
MDTYYFHLFFGEVHPYQVTAESFDSAIEKAFVHLREEEGYDLSPELIESNGDKSRVYRDKNDEEFVVDVNRYMGEKPWTTEKPAPCGDHVTGGPTGEVKEDFSSLGKFAVIL